VTGDAPTWPGRRSKAPLRAPAVTSRGDRRTEAETLSKPARHRRREGSGLLIAADLYTIQLPLCWWPCGPGRDQTAVSAAGRRGLRAHSATSRSAPNGSLRSPTLRNVIPPCRCRFRPRSAGVVAGGARVGESFEPHVQIVQRPRQIQPASTRGPTPGVRSNGAEPSRDPCEVERSSSTKRAQVSRGSPRCARTVASSSS